MALRRPVFPSWEKGEAVEQRIRTRSESPAPCLQQTAPQREQVYALLVDSNGESSPAFRNSNRD